MTRSHRILALAPALLLVLLASGAASCGGQAASSEDGVSVVAAFYPLAWVAEQVGGSRVSVQDLTPPHGEPHDLSLSARQVAEVQRARLLLMIGHGFQPQLESAARDASGTVLDLSAGQDLLPSNEEGLSADPHLWLDPVVMEAVAEQIGRELQRIDPAGRARYEQGARETAAALSALDEAIRAGLASCRYATMIVTHEAFGYFAARYGLRQLGVTGLTPDAEPGADAIRRAADAIHSGQAAAVFYELSDQGRRIGQSVAGDLGVQALPLNTLESDPAPKDYVSSMRANLTALKQGLSCGT